MFIKAIRNSNACTAAASAGRMVVDTMGLWLRCSHKNTTFPITRPRRVKDAFRVADTYIVCLDCGYEMPYSWNEMKAYKERRKSRSHQASHAEEAVAAYAAAD
jgi:hypothetical protein